MQDSQGVVVLGSTGSVGRSTLDVLAAFSERFHVVGLAAHSDHATLQDQVRQFKPQFAVLTSDASIPISDVEVINTPDSLFELATMDGVDIVVVATTGHAAIPATIGALEAGKVVALANKETVVAAGPIVMPVARRYPGQLRPVDSEHSAIWQCLPSGMAPQSVAQILLTASGGPFRGWSEDELEHVDVKQALKHPTWEMGKRITIDSATLMNKGFELIETAWLFDCPIDRINIVLHPQSIVHSMVEYEDGSMLAQLASHDMRLPIQHALTYPERLHGPGKRLTVQDFARLDFEEPDLKTFRAPELARQAFKAGDAYPAVLSTADEIAVEAFLDKRIRFSQIIDLVEQALNAFEPDADPLTLEKIDRVDRWTTAYVSGLLNGSTV